MYKELIIGMELKDSEAGRFNKERILFQKNFQKVYGKYKRKTYLFGENFEYVIPSNKEDLNIVLEKIKPFIKHFELRMRTEEKYEAIDYDKAVAYKVEFPYGFDEYDNFHDKEELELEISKCNACAATDKKEILYLSFQGNDKFKKGCAGHSDEYEDQIISILLEKHLTDAGIDKDFFKPVYNIRKKLLGYRLYGEKNVLPPKSIVINGEEDYVDCESCGSASIRQLPPYSINIENTWSIDDWGIDALCDINQTYEYRPIYRLVIINKNTYSSIKEVWPEVTKYVIPIFRR